jgi:hypothetical protein
VQDSSKKIASLVTMLHGQLPEVAAPIGERLSPEQQHVLLHNGLVLAVRAASGHLPEHVASAVDAYSKAHPDNLNAGLLAAAASTHGGHVEVQQLQTLPGPALKVVLLAGHIAANSSPIMLDKLLASLQENIPEELRYAPALVATRVRAIQQYGSNSSQQVELQLREATSWWYAQPASLEQAMALGALLEPLAAACMDLGNMEGTAAALEKLQVCNSIYCCCYWSICMEGT